jgi:hypothetical protein
VSTRFGRDWLGLACAFSEEYHDGFKRGRSKSSCWTSNNIKDGPGRGSEHWQATHIINNLRPLLFFLLSTPNHHHKFRVTRSPISHSGSSCSPTFSPSLDFPLARTFDNLTHARAQPYLFGQIPVLSDTHAVSLSPDHSFFFFFFFFFLTYSLPTSSDQPCMRLAQHVHAGYWKRSF